MRIRQTRTPVYWSTLQHGQWTMHVAATDAGLCCITLPNERWETLEEWVGKHVLDAALVHDPTQTAGYTGQLKDYLSGRRQVFTGPLDLRGTAFQVQVWRALTRIPYGEVKSYSDVAQLIGRPPAIRAVGAASGANPIPIVVPCHRVVGKDGTLTGYRGGVEMKAQLLALEGL